ncbi:class I SAM-dependent methyltransferase [Francisellaceae bacterium]|nr:class I SAM-dependent methyltransferase [Francisellaceae bacterium]
MHKFIKGNYGIDAPYVPITFIGISLAFFILCIIYRSYSYLFVSLFFLINSLIYLHTSLRGKFYIWNKLIGKYAPENITKSCDIACGRGLALIQTAIYYPSAVAEGIDIWNKMDQSGNSPEQTKLNAQKNQAKNIKIATGNMLKLPYENESFELVTSSIAIHSLKSSHERNMALSEIYRITKPGGRIIIVDFKYTKSYAKQLNKLSGKEIIHKSCGFKGWFGNPLYSNKVLIFEK